MPWRWKSGPSSTARFRRWRGPCVRTDRRLALAVIPWVAWAFDAEAQLGGTAPDGTPNISFTPGLRLQPTRSQPQSAGRVHLQAGTRSTGSERPVSGPAPAGLLIPKPSSAMDEVSHCGELAAPAAAP